MFSKSCLLVWVGIICLGVSVSSSAGEKSPWTAEQDAAFFSEMVAAYETIAFTAQPLVEKSESISMRIMANDRVSAMKRVSKKIARHMKEKEWKIDSTHKKETDKKMGDLLAAKGGTVAETGLLDALREFHMEIARRALAALDNTGDEDVAAMADEIIADQVRSILAAKNMPKMISLEAEFGLMGRGLPVPPAPVAPQK